MQRMLKNNGVDQKAIILSVIIARNILFLLL